MLFGRPAGDGKIRLDKTLREMGIDDLGGLLPREREATVVDEAHDDPGQGGR